MGRWVGGLLVGELVVGGSVGRWVSGLVVGGRWVGGRWI